MEPTNYTKQIIRFLNNEMNATEDAKFKDEMDYNDALCETFLKTITEAKIQNDINQIVKQNSKEEISKKKKVLNFAFLLKIAAVFLIILTPAVFLINYYSTNNTSLISDKNMNYLSGDITRGNANPNLSQLEFAFRLYDKKKYAKAAVLFSAISDTSTNASRFELYAGINLIWCGTHEDLQKAKIYLGRATNSKNVYSTAASWFYAIALYETGEKVEAKKIFIKFANCDSSNFKKQEAKTILAEFYRN